MLQISCFFRFFAKKTLKMAISTSVWSAQHPNAGRNIQQLVLSLGDLYVTVFVGPKYTKTNLKYQNDFWAISFVASVGFGLKHFNQILKLLCSFLLQLLSTFFCRCNKWIILMPQANDCHYIYILNLLSLSLSLSLSLFLTSSSLVLYVQVCILGSIKIIPFWVKKFLLRLANTLAFTKLSKLVFQNPSSVSLSSKQCILLLVFYNALTTYPFESWMQTLQILDIY